MKRTTANPVVAPMNLVIDNTSACRRLLLLIVSFILSMSCSSLSVGDGTRLRVTITEEPNPLEPAEVGAIYVQDRSSGPDLRVGIRRDHTWTISTEMEPGWFTLGMRSGRIENGVAVGFPTDLLSGSSDRIHAEGEIRAWLGNTAVAHGDRARVDPRSE